MNFDVLDKNLEKSILLVNSIPLKGREDLLGIPYNLAYGFRYISSFEMKPRTTVRIERGIHIAWKRYRLEHNNNPA